MRGLFREVSSDLLSPASLPFSSDSSGNAIDSGKTFKNIIYNIIKIKSKDNTLSKYYLGNILRLIAVIIL